MYTGILSLIHMLTLNQQDTERYCRKMRYERFEKYGARIRFLYIHNLTHGIFLVLLKGQRRIKKQKLVVVHDRRRRTNAPIIICPTHIGGADIEMTFEAIKTPCWLAWGDPRELYKHIDGMMLQINGVIPFDTCHKKDRVIAKANMEALLRKGGNLLIFPEGAYNITQELLLNHLYAGAVELAITCHAEIIPVALVRDQNTYYINIGENIDYSSYSKADSYALTDALRDCIATLEWEILEKLPLTKREELSEEYQEQFIAECFEMGDSYTYTVQDIQETVFKPKDQTSPKEAFAYLDKLSH